MSAGVPPAQVALAWLLHKPGVTAPIVGATKLDHLEDAIAAEQLDLDRRRDRSGSRSRTCRTPCSGTEPAARPSRQPVKVGSAATTTGGPVVVVVSGGSQDSGTISRPLSVSLR